MEKIFNTTPACFIRFLTVLGITLVFLTVGYTQITSPQTTFPMTDSYNFKIYRTGNGNFLVAGRTFSTITGDDIYCAFHTKSGEKVWAQNLWGTLSDYVIDLLEDKKGNFLFGCNTNSQGAGYNDFLTVICNNAGDTLWTGTYGGNKFDVLTTTTVTSENNYLLCGYSTSFNTGTNSDLLFVLTNDTGVVKWAKTYQAGGDEELYSIKNTLDKGFIGAGYTTSWGALMKEVLVIKADSNGTQQWVRSIGGSNDEEAQDVIAITDSQNRRYYYVSGWTKSYSGTKDLFVLKLDSVGNMVWKKAFDFGFAEKAQQIVFHGGSIYITGYVTSTTGTYDDILIIKLDTSGYLIKSAHIPLPNNQYGVHARGLESGNLLFGAISFDSVLTAIVRSTDTSLNTCQMAVVIPDTATPVFVSSSASFVIKTADSLIALHNGLNRTSLTSPVVVVDVCYISPNDTLVSAENKSIYSEMEAGSVIFPNPASAYINLELPQTMNAFPITMTILGVRGDKILQMIVREKRTFVPVEGLPSGFYSVLMEGEGYRKVKKLIVVD